ncbi:MAG: hypothetical protein HZB70_00720 [Candidatus Berkelbacteria bacterium]|nr:MAG: hypothetical protein HZB70_00720 [Candidatus Berkelbacteria bacterium]QQG52139.1 MAG: hypothetical protein HY845_02275 [Candidatus Berkelbacteria bacterium]
MPQDNFRGRPGFWIAIVALALLGAGYFAYSFYSKNKSSDDSKPSTTETPPASVNSPTPEDPCSEWKQYTNSEFRFSLCYPPAWQLTEDEASAFTKENTRLLFQVTIQQADGQRVSSIGVFSNVEGLELGKWIDKYNPNPNTYAEVTVDGEPARKFEKTAMGSKATNIYTIFIQRIYALSSTPGNTEFERILSSFRFLR